MYIPEAFSEGLRAKKVGGPLCGLRSLNAEDTMYSNSVIKTCASAADWAG